MRYFFSKTNDLYINWHESMGGLFNLGFMEGKHNYNTGKAEMSQKDLRNGTDIDLTRELSQFKADHGESGTNYLYFFCPYADPDVSNLAFEYEINLDKKEVTLPPPSTGGNNGGRPLNEYERIQQIMGELTKDDNTSDIQEKVKEANMKYNEVKKIEIKTNFDEKDSPEIVKVRI